MIDTTKIQDSFTKSMPDDAFAYRDHANEKEAPHLLHQLILEGSLSRNGSDHSFPVKLHYILGKTAEDGLSHIVSWQPHGRCFLVHDQKEFVARVLKCWFRQSKFTSFQRQLNIYGFRRLTTGRDKGGYYHEFFLRSRPLLAHRILRNRIKGTRTRKPSSPETEPNFYLMDYLPGVLKHPTLVTPTASPPSLQSLLPATLESEPAQQTLHQPQLPKTQAMLDSHSSVQEPNQAHQANQEHQVPQAHSLPSLCPREDTPRMPFSFSLAANQATLNQTGTIIEPSLARLVPLMSFLMSSVSPGDPPISQISIQNNVLRDYEEILSVMRGTKHDHGKLHEA